MKGVIWRLLVAIGIGILVIIFLMGIPENPDGVFSDLNYQLNIEKGSSDQIRETISFAGTVIGCVIVLVMIRFWIRFRNGQDSHYWNGHCDTVTMQPYHRNGFGKTALHEGVEIHRTVANLTSNPGRGQNGAPGIK